MQRLLFKRAFLFMLLASLVMAGSAFALSGDLDTTFNGTGYNVDAVSGATAAWANKTIVLSDDYIVSAGAVRDSVSVYDNVVVRRYDPGGNTDVTRTFDFGADAYGVSVLQDGGTGGIIVLAAVNNGWDYDIVLFRLNNDATLSLDTTFAAPSGYFYYDSAGTRPDDSPSAMVQQPDGKIVVVGTRYDLTWVLAPKGFVLRVAASGLGPDTSFATSGLYTVSGIAANEYSFYDVVIDGSGNIVSAGGRYDGSSFLTAFVMRLNSSGGGMAFGYYNISGSAWDWANAIALTSGGNYVIGGSADGDSFVAEVNSALPNGAGAASWVYLNDFGASDEVNDIAIDGSGNIIAGGMGSNGSDYDLLVFRLTPGGALDTTFSQDGSTDGWTLIDLGGIENLYSLALQPADGKIVFAGHGSFLTGRLIGVDYLITVNGADTGFSDGVIGEILGWSSETWPIWDDWDSTADGWVLGDNTARVNGGSMYHYIDADDYFNWWYNTTWAGCDVAYGNGTPWSTCEITGPVTSDKTVTVTYSRATYNLNVNVVNPAGCDPALQITGTGDSGFAYGPTCASGATTFDVSNVNVGGIVMTANATAGYTVAWSGDCDTTAGNGTATATCTIVDDNGGYDRTVTATYTPITYNLTVNINPSGSVTGAGTGWAYGPTSTSGATTFNITNLNLTLTATPAAGYQNPSWAGCDAGNGTAVCTINSIGDKTVTVSFTPITYTLDVTIGANGSASGAGAGGWPGFGSTAGPEVVNTTFDITNLNITLTGVPNAGLIAQWTGCDAGNGTATCTINSIGNKAPSVSFVNPFPDLIVLLVDGPGAASKYSMITITAAVQNIGGVPLVVDPQRPLAVRFYLSTDTTITAADTYIGVHYIAGGTVLNPGDTITIVKRLRLPNITGTYYIGAIADATGLYVESNEANNTGFDPAVINIQ